VLERAGLTVRAIADWLGHADVTTTQNHYFGRKMITDQSAAVLEVIGEEPTAARREGWIEIS
jgi:integrase